MNLNKIFGDFLLKLPFLEPPQTLVTFSGDPIQPLPFVPDLAQWARESLERSVT